MDLRAFWVSSRASVVRGAAVLRPPFMSRWSLAHPLQQRWRSCRKMRENGQSSLSYARLHESRGSRPRVYFHLWRPIGPLTVSNVGAVAFCYGFSCAVLVGSDLWRPSAWQFP